ncbi:Response regulator [Rhodovastum atsumiense]|uniref:Response regulator n=1 Tax=Rhodovastum atsumiense TaxID=504468 RepID=A0A5M6ILE8_9PROT|nr:response regulator [Rhodovastum atsumiense]KAA5608757.1 response regulator [Rhodovastum atsumiense]CAH2603031.1 Response regulator [Rhodovastum atsumiense]
MGIDGLAGCRVLVVEDEPLLAIELEGLLQEFGCVVVGPVSSLARALQLAQDGSFDVALLDVVIRGGDVYPVADLLIARGIPFALASGYSKSAFPERLRQYPRLLKPFTRSDMADTLTLLRGALSVS